MNKEFEDGHDKLTDETRGNLKNLSKAMLRLHKTLLDAAKMDYEAKNGAIASVNQYFQLVIDDPHFAWLRKISSLIALIDEAVSVRRPATEGEAKGLENEAKLLLNFQDGDESFNEKFQTALQNNQDAVLGYNDALKYLD
ncbi:MAG: hypothetical protein LUM44_08795 [Pyrinomonadaceae bacterium]|nr:hypothetical protein [Pyrinomonadaceae bacterium]